MTVPLRPSAPHTEEAEARLRELGYRVERVSAAGYQGEIAALAVPAAEFARLLGVEGPRVAGCLRELGFRYVALDLGAAEEGGEG